MRYVALAASLLISPLAASAIAASAEMMGDTAQSLTGPPAPGPGRTPDEWSAFMATQRQRTILTPRADGSYDEPVSYDTFYLAAREDRTRMFASMTPQQRAALALEHLARWREKNGYRLTEIQQQVLEQVRGFTARTHNPREWLDPDFNQAFAALSRELQRHFTPADIRDLFGVDGDYIAK